MMWGRVRPPCGGFMALSPDERTVAAKILRAFFDDRAPDLGDDAVLRGCERMMARGYVELFLLITDDGYLTKKRLWTDKPVAGHA